jgi:hydrogenase expression/formation protein HypD
MDEEGILAAFHDPALAGILAERLKTRKIQKQITLMHVCGTHEHSLARAGIRSILPEGLRLVAGPGCPVCVCPAADIDLAFQVLEGRDRILATFGDMFRVPSGDSSLELMKAEGADVRVVYSPLDAVRIAEENPDREVVFMAVGFETTAGPVAASILAEPPENYSMIASMRLVPPALEYLLQRAKGDLDGFILPGHVSTVLGRSGYSFLETRWSIPGVIAGFEPLDVLQGILTLIDEVEKGPPARVLNLYGRVVTEEGNARARDMIEKVFMENDSSWRGIGMIPESGLALRGKFEKFDAVNRFGLLRDPEVLDVLPGCICHKVILGEAESEECPLFGKECTPRKPFGPCMVSSEGTCRARYQYRAPGST